MNFAVPIDNRVKIKDYEKRHVLGPCLRTKRVVGHKGDNC